MRILSKISVIDVMMVIAILLILSAIVFPRFSR
jgi:hypothetical protein